VCIPCNLAIAFLANVVVHSDNRDDDRIFITNQVISLVLLHPSKHISFKLPVPGKAEEREANTMSMILVQWTEQGAAAFSQGPLCCQ